MKIPGLPESLPNEGKLTADEHKDIINVLHQLLLDVCPLACYADVAINEGM